MGRKIYEYQNGYTYEEFSTMCGLFKNLRLPGYKDYDLDCVLASYIFDYSMKRFPIGVKSTLRRFLGGMFLYPAKIEGKGENAFVFTGDTHGRPDYIDSIHKVKSLFKDSLLIAMNRDHPHFKITHLFSGIIEFAWALKLNRLNRDFNISFDMAVYLYRAKMQGEFLYDEIKTAKRIITFCDMWSIENLITQKANSDGKRTATLQHGNGTEVLYGTCSNYYLANSLLSKANCLSAGIPIEKVVVTGPMKYAGERFAFRTFSKVERVGVVFDGAHNFVNNIEMIQLIHEATKNTKIQCCIRFHPNNNPEEYIPYISSNDEICGNLQEFERTVDICVVYNSSMYTDMIYKKILVYRFKNGRVDLYPGLGDHGFTNVEELKTIINNVETKRNECIDSQTELYCKIFGQECNADGYSAFFKYFGEENEE